jgi:hypothetical protein
LLTRDEALMEKKANPVSLATALAKRVLPVPGGLYSWCREKEFHV